MSGYIDENERIADDIHNAYEEGYADGKRDAVVHGHWIEQQTSNLYKCSVCGERIYSSRKVGNLHAFCRYCGAKMDEVTE